MITSFLIKTVLKALLLPPTSLLLVALGGILLWRRFPRAGRGAAVCALFTLLALSTPVVARLLVEMLELPQPFDVNSASRAGAIVILGGGARRPAPEYGRDTVSSLTLERVRYGAYIAKVTRLPVLVSGGAPGKAEPEARLMRRVLEDEFGVPVRWVEERSSNTHENAVNSARILQGAGVTNVVLVNHAFDIRRAVAEFDSAGITAIPAPTNVPARSAAELTVYDWLPGISGLQGSYYATYEIAANLVRGLPSW